MQGWEEKSSISCIVLDLGNIGFSSIMDFIQSFTFCTLEFYTRPPVFHFTLGYIESSSIMDFIKDFTFCISLVLHEPPAFHFFPSIAT
jgi:hypothetical protein